jgi:hypothetical protein
MRHLGHFHEKLKSTFQFVKKFGGLAYLSRKHFNTKTLSPAGASTPKNRCLPINRLRTFDKRVTFIFDPPLVSLDS